MLPWTRVIHVKMVGRGNIQTCQCTTVGVNDKCEIQTQVYITLKFTTFAHLHIPSIGYLIYFF